MGTKTINYGLNKPAVDGDNDTWGEQLNAGMDTIDAQMKANQDTAEKAEADALVADAKATSAGQVAGLAMPLLGGTFTGSVTFSGGATFATAAVFSSTVTISNADGSVAVQIGTSAAKAFYAVDVSGGHSFLDAASVVRASVDIADNTDLVNDTSLVTRARGDVRYLTRSAADAPILAHGKVNGTTGAIVKANNLTCSRTAAGNYTVGFNGEDPDDSSYTVQLTSMSDGGNTEARAVCTVIAGSQSTVSFNVQIVSGNSGTPFDPDNFYVTVLR